MQRVFWQGMGKNVCAGLMVLSLVACGSEEQERDNNSNVNNVNNEQPSDVVMDWEGPVEQPTLWEGSVTVLGNVPVSSKLTIKPCTTVYMSAGTRIDIQDSGSIHSVGTEKCPITFRSAKTSPEAGDWDQLAIDETASSDSVFEYTSILHGGGGGDWGALYVDGGATVAVRNGRFESIAGIGTYLADGARLKAFSDVHFQGTGKAPIFMDMNLAGHLENITGEELGESWIALSNSGVESSAVWKKQGLPYNVTWGYSNIKASLTIEAGTTVLMSPGTSLHVVDGGAIKSQGTAEEPIVFTSAKDSPEAGDWDRIEIDASASTDSVFEHTQIMHGGGSGDWGVLFVDGGATVTVRDARFESIEGIGVYLDDGSRLKGFSNVHFNGIGKAPLRMDMNLAGQLENITGEGLGEHWIALSNSGVSSPAVWKKQGLPYNAIWATSNIKAPLTIEAGTTVLMSPNTGLAVVEGGSIKTQGTAEEPVVFESSKSGPGAGDWESISIDSSASRDSKLSHTVIRHGGGNGDWGTIYVDNNAEIELEHVTFESNHTCDVYVNDSGQVHASETEFVSCR